MVQAARNGWVILAWNLMSLQLQVILIDSHDQHVPFGIMPIAVLDMWEHSYVPDFGIDRAQYFTWWLARMDWLNPAARLESLK
jgi:Fe-Mn family superoxide dismutase